MNMNNQSDASVPSSNGTLETRQNSGYWYENIQHGDMPFAPSGYQMFRNVKEFGATGDGSTDDTAAINRAASWLSPANDNERCGRECGQTTIQGAVVYFPVSAGWTENITKLSLARLEKAVLTELWV